MRKLLWVLPLLVTLVGCGPGIRIQTVFEPSVDFSGRSYDWMGDSIDDIMDPRVNREVFDRRVKTAVESELAPKGYRRSSSGDAQLVFRYHVALDDQLMVSEVNAAYSDIPSGYTISVNTPRFSNVTVWTQGSLILDIFNGETRELMWRGSAESEIDLGLTPRERESLVNEAVRGILGDFPPQ